MGAVLRFVFLWPRCGCVHTSWGIAGCLLGSQHTQQTYHRPGLIGIGYLATFYSSSYTTSLTFTVCPLFITWSSLRFWIALSLIKTICHLHTRHFASNTGISIFLSPVARLFLSHPCKLMYAFILFILFPFNPNQKDYKG